ncbi:hypothetical protein QYF61_013315 [Mycteria americana]|uniref:Uncharacterized protein n=1 Tax=Mycteria americana TaxID=33587 RepID=A0AAN7N947_MYCAM|nr:hypothetical protein QYF61_013315 [Mycteria americana]
MMVASPTVYPNSKWSDRAYEWPLKGPNTKIDSYPHIEGVGGVHLAASDGEKRPEWTPARTDLLIGDSFSSSPAVGRNAGFFGTDMGAAASPEAPLCSPLGCILKNWKKFGGDPMTKNKLKQYCNQWWPQYQLEDGEKWPENGSLKYNTILQLMLFCRRTEKWDEIPYVDMFFALRNDWDIRKKCGLVDSKHQIGIYALKEKKGKSCCIESKQSRRNV